MFGGTFDPIHRAHVRAALAVSRALGDAPVHLLPNAVPPHRPQPRADGAQRLAMVRHACTGYPRLVADDWELRHPDGRPSFTLATLKHFRRLIGHRPLVFVVGADSFANLDQWHRWREYAALCHLAVVPRPGAAKAPLRVQRAFPAAGAALLRRRPAGRRLMLERPVLDVAATDIRRALRAGGPCPQLPAAVLAHIRRHGLYNASANTDNSVHAHNEAP
nr:nicotinate-nucleotide adenylyltransferase [Alloalcanivorax marinus]